MAALVRQIPRATIQKQLFGIRHGEGWHNVLYKSMGMQSYSEYADTTLTAEGMRQAANANAPEVDVVLVSPLMRTLQTANIMFPDTPTIALECLKEYPQEEHISNCRSETSLLQQLFPKVDFSDLKDETQPWPNVTDPATNLNRAKLIIATSTATRFAIVSHSTWLKYWITGTYADEPELKHCHAYELKI